MFKGAKSDLFYPYSVLNSCGSRIEKRLKLRDKVYLFDDALTINCIGTEFIGGNIFLMLCYSIEV